MIITSGYIENMKITQELLKKSVSCRSRYLLYRSLICQDSLKLVGLSKKGITLIIIFSIVKVKLLFKIVFISILIIPRILFIIEKYISKLSPSDNVNKNVKIYFHIQWESGQNVHKEKKKKICTSLLPNQEITTIKFIWQ